jgi:hypothetical protein
MSKTTLTLSEPVAQTLKVYTVQSKSSLRAQSEVVEEALIEFFERHGVKIDALLSPEDLDRKTMVI